METSPLLLDTCAAPEESTEWLYLPFRRHEHIVPQWRRFDAFPRNPWLGPYAGDKSAMAFFAVGSHELRGPTAAGRSEAVVGKGWLIATTLTEHQLAATPIGLMRTYLKARGGAGMVPMFSKSGGVAVVALDDGSLVSLRVVDGKKLKPRRLSPTNSLPVDVATNIALGAVTSVVEVAEDSLVATFVRIVGSGAVTVSGGSRWTHNWFVRFYSSQVTRSAQAADLVDDMMPKATHATVQNWVVLRDDAAPLAHDIHALWLNRDGGAPVLLVVRHDVAVCLPDAIKQPSARALAAYVTHALGTHAAASVRVPVMAQSAIWYKPLTAGLNTNVFDACVQSGSGEATLLSIDPRTGALQAQSLTDAVQAAQTRRMHEHKQLLPGDVLVHQQAVGKKALYLVLAYTTGAASLQQLTVTGDFIGKPFTINAWNVFKGLGTGEWYSLPSPVVDVELFNDTVMCVAGHARMWGTASDLGLPGFQLYHCGALTIKHRPDFVGCDGQYVWVCCWSESTGVPVVMTQIHKITSARPKQS